MKWNVLQFTKIILTTRRNTNLKYILSDPFFSAIDQAAAEWSRQNPIPTQDLNRIIEEQRTRTRINRDYFEESFRTQRQQQINQLTQQEISKIENDYPYFTHDQTFMMKLNCSQNLNDI